MIEYFPRALCSFFWYMNDEDHLWIRYLRSTIAVISTIGSFLLALWSYFFVNEGHQQCWYYLRATWSVHYMIESFLLAFLCGVVFLCCHRINKDDDHQWLYYPKIARAIPHIISFILDQVCSWCYMNEDDQLLWRFMESVTVVLSITGCFRPAYSCCFCLCAICLGYYFICQTKWIVSFFLKKTCTFSICLCWDELCSYSWMTKLIDIIGRIPGNPLQDYHGETIRSPTSKLQFRAKQADGITAIHSRLSTQVPGGLKDRVLRDPIGADYCCGYRNIVDDRQNWGDSAIVDWKDTTLRWRQSDNLKVFVNTHDGKIIELSVNHQDMVVHVRKKIHDILHVPLNQ